MTISLLLRKKQFDGSLRIEQIFLNFLSLQVWNELAS